MKLQYRIPLAIYSVWCIIAILLCKDGLYQMNIWTLVEILGMIALPLLVRPFFILLRIIFRKNSFKTKDMSDNHTVCVFLSALADTSSKKAIKKHFKQLLEKLPPLFAYSALFDHGLASKSDQRFASIRSTGNLTFSTAF